MTYFKIVYAHGIDNMGVENNSDRNIKVLLRGCI